jgi:hypothetical protein
MKKVFASLVIILWIITFINILQKILHTMNTGSLVFLMCIFILAICKLYDFYFK